ncbi:MAG: hypothetical protein ABFD66_04770 [Smithella sp.]
MEPLLKQFTISFLLRSIFAGGFFYISYEIGVNGYDNVFKIDSNSMLTLLPVLLLIGVTIYGFHRSFFYPFIENFFMKPKVIDFRRRKPLISDATSNSLIEIWQMGAEQDKEKQEFNRLASAWADFAHFQYTSALSIVAGAVFCKVTSTRPDNLQFYWPIFLLAVAFTVAGFTSDWRLRRVRDIKMNVRPSNNCYF